ATLPTSATSARRARLPLHRRPTAGVVGGSAIRPWSPSRPGHPPCQASPMKALPARRVTRPSAAQSRPITTAGAVRSVCRGCSPPPRSRRARDRCPEGARYDVVSALAIVLAAGQGTRMRSERPKPLHVICGRPMVVHVLHALEGLDIGRTAVVVGHDAP